MNLRALSDSDLINRLSEVNAATNQSTSALLRHLGEVDSRGLHTGIGFSSMFAYCTGRLNMCEGTAARRIRAARLCRQFPMVLEAIAQGQLHITGAAMLCGVLTVENHQAVLVAAAGKTKRQIEVLVADLSPKPSVPDRMRKLPTQAATATQPTIVRQPKAARPAPAPTPQPLGQSRYKVQFTASQALKDKIERAQALMRHRQPDGDLAALMDEALDLLIAKVEKQRFAANPKTQRKPARPRKHAKPSRHIPNPVKRTVHARDGGRCAFTAPDGTRCTEHGRLEFHHIRPWGQGGAHTADNVQLVCTAHNRHEANQDYGAGFIAQVCGAEPGG